MKKTLNGKKVLLILISVLAVVTLFYVCTRRIYFAEIELPNYCLYADSEYAKFKVVVKDKAVIQTVKCNSIISERESVKIAYRSKVYWGYTGQEPFKSTYGHGVEAPYAKTFPINPNAIVSNFYIHGKDFPIYITIFN